MAPNYGGDVAVGMMDAAYFVGRTELLDFINDTLDLKLQKIEQTASGAVACMLLDIMYPQTLVMSKVHWNAHTDYEFIQNYKLLQVGFTKHGVQRHVDVDKLIRAKYQDNLEFMQWFKAFFEQHSAGPVNCLAYNAREVRLKGKGGPQFDAQWGRVRVVPQAQSRPQVAQAQARVNVNGVGRNSMGPSTSSSSSSSSRGGVKPMANTSHGRSSISGTSTGARTNGMHATATMSNGNAATTTTTTAKTRTTKPIASSSAHPHPSSSSASVRPTQQSLSLSSAGPRSKTSAAAGPVLNGNGGGVVVAASLSTTQQQQQQIHQQQLEQLQKQHALAQLAWTREKEDLEQHCLEWQERCEEIEASGLAIEKERNYYFEKLRNVELLLQVYQQQHEDDAKENQETDEKNNNTNHFDLPGEAVEKMFKVLYATPEEEVFVSNDGELIPATEEEILRRLNMSLNGEEEEEEEDVLSA